MTKSVSPDQDVYPIALRYKEQLVERIEAPLVSGAGLSVAEPYPSALTPGPQLPGAAPLALSGSDLHFLLMSLQQ